jgi:hypothetical protein
MEEIQSLSTMEVAEQINKNFNEFNTLPSYSSYAAVSRFKSIRRAIKRGHVDMFFGSIYPKRPFNNRKPTFGRAVNEEKKKAYDHIRIQ